MANRVYVQGQIWPKIEIYHETNPQESEQAGSISAIQDGRKLPRLSTLFSKL